MAKSGTRDQLIEAAEKLFAERGIDGVSLREINLAAGQKNTSAAHYHFGSKDALIDAIFEFRRPVITARLGEMLERIEAEGKTGDLRTVVEAMVHSVSAEMDDPGGSHYILFLAHILHQPPANMRDILRRHSSGNREIAVRVTSILPQMPGPILRQRLILMVRHVILSLAAFQRLGERERSEIQDMTLDSYLANMVDSIVGYLSVEPSPQALAELESARKGA